MLLFRLSSNFLLVCAAVLLATRTLGADANTATTPLENLARSARITASSEHAHLPANAVADGRISPAGAALGEIGSWAILGDQEKNQGTITFDWPQPVQVSEIVYFGRCAWQMEECFKSYEVFADDQKEPVAAGELQKVAGSQPITFAARSVRRLTLKFTSSHGGSNPGAAEIMVFAKPLTSEQLDRVVRFAPNSLISDHIVLQQRRPLRIWGTAADGELVSVRFRGHTLSMTAANGTWHVELPPQLPGEPSEMIIESAAGKFVVKDVLVGEVWVASGQSNMEMPVDVSYWPGRYDGVMNAKAEVAAANWPQIRMFYVPRVASAEKRADTGGQWRVCSPETVGGFSAVGYFFARELHKGLDVPVGIIDCSWGATYIEPWTSLEGLQSVPELSDIAQKATDELAEYEKALTANPANPPAAHQHQPTRLFNGMMYRLTPSAIRGAIWYQGEGNVGDGMRYFDKMRALIDGWRHAWGSDDFPFLFVQLAPYDYGMYKGPKDPYLLPAVWEAQTRALSIPNTGMVVTTDISDVKNIHPPNKQEVGRRLALWALATTYEKPAITYRGPQFRSAKHEPGQIRLLFDHCDGGLKSRDNMPLTWFTIAGADQVFHPAEAEIDGQSVVVRSSKVEKPLHVRFAWHKLAEPNLCNQAGLPTVPFRTDNWSIEIQP